MLGGEHFNNMNFSFSEERAHTQVPYYETEVYAQMCGKRGAISLSLCLRYSLLGALRSGRTPSQSNLVSMGHRPRIANGGSNDGCPGQTAAVKPSAHLLADGKVNHGPRFISDTHSSPFAFAWNPEAADVVRAARLIDITRRQRVELSSGSETWILNNSSLRLREKPRHRIAGRSALYSINSCRGFDRDSTPSSAIRTVGWGELLRHRVYTPAYGPSAIGVDQPFNYAMTRS